jgi:hypothetical protein
MIWTETDLNTWDIRDMNMMLAGRRKGGRRLIAVTVGYLKY